MDNISKTHNLIIIDKGNQPPPKTGYKAPINPDKARGRVRTPREKKDWMVR